MRAKVIVRSDIGDGKLDFVKQLKVLTGWSLNETLEFVNSIPATTPDDFDVYVARDIAKLFAKYGADADVVENTPNETKKASTSVSQNDINELHKLISALSSRIDALETKISKLGSASSKSAPAGDVEEIVAKKETSSSYYYKTNKGRIVEYGQSWFPYVSDSNLRTTDEIKPDYLTKLKSVLIEIGEEDTLKGADKAAVVECVARLRAKMGATTQYGVFLPNGITLWPNGFLLTVSPTNKNIKF